MPSTLPLYSVRASTRPKSIQGVDLVLFEEGLRRLYGSAEETAGSRHAPGYAALVLEAASSTARSEEERHPSAREFAAYFLSKDKGYSTTKAGISALLFETWLYRQGGDLLGQFVETVLSEGPTEYLAIFMGAISEENLRRMSEKMADFATFEVLVRCGDRDYQQGIISDVTMLRCTARPGAIDPANKEKKEGGELAQPELSTNPPPTTESLLPRTRADYERVVTEGGLSANTLMVVFGGNPFANTEVRGTTLAVRDANGVSWLREQGCAVWLPDVSTFPIEQAPRTTLAPAVIEAEDELPTAYEERELFERCVDTGSVRSLTRAWSVFEAPVRGGRSTTIVTVAGSSWSVSNTVDEMVEAVERIATIYADMPDGFDIMVEQYLTEFVEDVGTRTANSAAVSTIVEGWEGAVAARNARLAHLYPLGPVLNEAFGQPPASNAPPKDDAEDGAEEPPAPPPPPEPPPASDRMDEPPYYRDDLQGYYDLQITKGLSPGEAATAVRKRFKVKGLVVTPTGEVRAPGVVDRPKSDLQPPPPPEIAAPPPPPPQEPAPGAPAAGGSATPAKPPAGAQEGAQALTAAEAALLEGWLAQGGPATGAPPPLARAWARSGRRSESEAVRLWDALVEGHRDRRDADYWGERASLWKGQVRGPAVEPGERIELASLDDALLYWMIVQDGDLDDFHEWVEQHCPHLANSLETWQPQAAPITENRVEQVVRHAPSKARQRVIARVKRNDERLSETQREQYAKWQRLVNVPAPELRRFLQSRPFREALAGPHERTSDLRLALESAKFALAMKATRPEEWTNEMWNWCGRQSRFISRLRGSSAALVEQGQLTRKYVTLKAWGHDAGSPGVLDESDFVALRSREDGAQAVCRVIDALAGPAPHRVGVAEEGAPDFATLRAHRVPLTLDEIAECVARKAVLTPRNGGTPHPQVWKSEIGESAWFVSNTHRAYNVARDLSGAITRYLSTIKLTA